MTGPGVPSPQEELAAEVRALLAPGAQRGLWSPGDADDITAVLVPLFAARVAAIEAERDEALALWRAAYDWGKQFEERSVEAIARVAAERTQAAAQAWWEGWHENYRVNFESHITAGNPYRAAADSGSSPAVVSGDNIENPPADGCFNCGKPMSEHDSMAQCWPVPYASPHPYSDGVTRYPNTVTYNVRPPCVVCGRRGDDPTHQATPQPAEHWCAGHNDGTAHPFNGHMTCHDCGAVNWKACYHAVADTVQDDEPLAGSGSTDQPPAEVCPECRYERLPYTGTGTPVYMPGTPHHADCPTLPRLTPEAQAQLNADLREIHDSQRRAQAQAHNIVIGSAGGSTDGAGTPAATREILADLANDAQDMGTYGGPLHVCPYGCECPEHNPARAGGPDA